MWKEYLEMNVSNYGVSGAGFSSLQGKSHQEQVDETGVFDIYILRASTNDYTNKKLLEITLITQIFIAMVSRN